MKFMAKTRLGTLCQGQGGRVLAWPGIVKFHLNGTPEKTAKKLAHHTIKQTTSGASMQNEILACICVRQAGRMGSLIGNGMK